MSILSNLKVYAGKWSVKKEEAFPQEDKALISKVVVTESDYGNSACFFLKTGGQVYIPLANDSTLGLGEEINVDNIILITLEKDGESDIVRVKEK